MDPELTAAMKQHNDRNSFVTASYCEPIAIVVPHQFWPYARPERKAVGEWYNCAEAKALGLVDEISTSDDRLLALSKECDLLRLEWKPPVGVGARLREMFSAALGSTVDATRQAEIDARLP